LIRSERKSYGKSLIVPTKAGYVEKGHVIPIFGVGGIYKDY
jgi:hypothetical protein